MRILCLARRHSVIQAASNGRPDIECTSAARARTCGRRPLTQVCQVVRFFPRSRMQENAVSVQGSRDAPEMFAHHHISASCCRCARSGRYPASLEAVDFRRNRAPVPARGSADGVTPFVAILELVREVPSTSCMRRPFLPLHVRLRDPAARCVVVADTTRRARVAEATKWWKPARTPPCLKFYRRYQL